MITARDIRDFECICDPKITLNLPRSRRTPGALERFSSAPDGISIALILPVQIASNVSARQARMTLGRSSEIGARERRVDVVRVDESSINKSITAAIAGTVSALSVASFALTISGCSYGLSQHKYAAYYTPPHLRSGLQTVRNYRALVAPQPPPHCELMESQPDIVDAELWTRLKLDYERHCYQRAEALVRKRLQRLLTSGRCRIEPD
jgi:hypothetical protein